MLLGSPPDMVHGIPLRKTGPLNTAYKGQTIQTKPGCGNSPLL